MSVKKGSYVIAGTPRTTGGVEIGDMGFAPLGIDESLNLRRYLNGQVISQSQFVSFTNKVKSAVALFPNLSTTEANWQAEKALSKFGQVGKFVIDDENQTIRLPAVVNAQGLLGLSGIGNLVNESLPNITGNSGALIPRSTSGSPTGAFKNTGSVVANMASGNNIGSIGLGFDASDSSSTYQDGAPVQQEAIQYPYYIQVATGVEETLPAIREYEINTPFFFGQSMYSENAPYNASWLASKGQYNAASVYPDFWTQLTGVELNTSLNVGDTIEIGGKTYVKRGLPVVLSTGAYTDYDFVVNQNDQTFRLPLLNGEEDLPSSTSTTLATTVSNGDQYVADVNSYISIACILASGSRIKITNIDTGEVQGSGAGSNTPIGATVFVRKGERAIFNLSGTLSDVNIAKIKAVGNGTLYYYVGDSVQDASLINAGAVLGQLSNKADIDASNFNASGKSLLSGLGMPSSRYIDLVLGASGVTYTAPANGYVYLEMIGTQAQQNAYITSPSNFHGTYYGGYNPANGRYGHSIIYPVSKGEVFTVVYSYTELALFRFFYAEGEN